MAHLLLPIRFKRTGKSNPNRDEMRSPRRPRQWRWLNAALVGAPLLVFGLLLKLAEGPACRLLAAPWGRCPSYSDVLYESLFGVAAVCLFYSLYRGYRDLCRGDLERDLAKWCGRLPGQKPVGTNAVKKTLRYEVSMTTIPSPDSKWADEIGNQVGEMLEKSRRAQSA